MNFIESIIKARFRSHMGSKIVGDCGSAIKYPYLWLVPTRSCVIISSNNHIFPPSALGSVLSNLAACSELLITITLPPPLLFHPTMIGELPHFSSGVDEKKVQFLLDAWAVTHYLHDGWFFADGHPADILSVTGRTQSKAWLLLVRGKGGRVGDNNS